MAEMDKLAAKILPLLKGNGLQVKIFDADGNETTDPKQGRRFFVMDPNIMITVNDGLNEDDTISSLEFSKGADVGDSVDSLQKRIRDLASEFQINSTVKVFGKQIQPRDYAYQAKMNNSDSMMENMEPVNHHAVGQIMQLVRAFTVKNHADYGKPDRPNGIGLSDLSSNLGLYDLQQLQKILNYLVEQGKLQAKPYKGQMFYCLPIDEAVMENRLQPGNDEMLGALYDKAISAFGARGKHTAQSLAQACKTSVPAITPVIRSLIMNSKITANGRDPGGEHVYQRVMSESIKESFSKMFGSSKTSQQTLENVRILVRHATPVDENVRGSRTRSINAIFLECNGERMRFQHNYLPGARAMAQHMAHGGNMYDKVGAYISESTSQLLKLQSFNRYVTTNKLINEDSSGIVETVKENIETLRTELKKLTGSKTYETVKARLETFEREPLAEDDTSGLKDLFTIRRFDEKFEEVLPIVKQLIQEKNTFHKRIEEAAANTIVLRRESLNTTPMFEFASENARLGFKLNEFALRIMENDELSSFVNKIGTKLCKEGMVNDFEKAVLKQVLENSVVEEMSSTGTKEIKESMDLEAHYDKYIYNFF